MSATDSTMRPERKRAPVPTYNLKALSDIAKRGPKSNPEKRSTPNPAAHTPFLFAHDKNSNMSQLSPPSAFTPGESLPHATAERPENQKHKTELTNTPEHAPTKSGCFNKHTNIRGHYYSATELFDHGVWVGYLAPGRQNEFYRKLPSYSDLKTNCVDMDLPFPPGIASSSPKNRYAICGGCLSEQSSLLTLREVKFVHKKNLVIMLLDGDDEVGLFCILLPQPLDRSMKNIEAWRPYEVRNDGDGKKFDNNFVSYTLRYTNEDVGTKDTILAALESRKAGTGSESHMIGSTSVGEVPLEADSLGGLFGASAIPLSKKQGGKKR